MPDLCFTLVCFAEEASDYLLARYSGFLCTINVSAANMTNNTKFIAKNLGRYAVRCAGILVHRAFDKSEQAKEWGQWNYKNRANWTIERLSKDTLDHVNT